MFAARWSFIVEMPLSGLITLAWFLTEACLPIYCSISTKHPSGFLFMSNQRPCLDDDVNQKIDQKTRARGEISSRVVFLSVTSGTIAFSFSL